MTFFIFIIFLIGYIHLLFKTQHLGDRINNLEAQNKNRNVNLVTPTIASMEVPANMVGTPPLIGQTSEGNQPEAQTQSQSPYPSQLQTPPKEFDEVTGGQVLGKVGIFAILLGVSFFLRYAFVNNIIGIGGRILIGIVTGFAALGIGHWLKAKYQEYGDALRGGGIGILYLTVFASFQFYHVISQPVAYGLLILITALSVVLSIADGAITLAVVGISCGFITPLLMSLREANFAQLLIYVLILDAGVLLTAYVYKWITLNYLAFFGTAFTYMMGIAFLYNDGLRFTALTFAMLFFCIFLLTTILHHLVRKEKSTQVDLVIITLNAFFFAGVSYSLLNPIIPKLMGFYMLGIAVVYAVIAFAAFITNKEDNLIVSYLTGLAVVFLTVAIPLHFSGVLIGIIWFIEAIVLFVVDYSVRGRNLYSFGTIVYAIGLVRILTFDGVLFGSKSDASFLFNKHFALSLVAIISAYIIAAICRREWKMSGFLEARTLLTTFVIVAQLLTIFAVTAEINLLYSQKLNGVGYESTTTLINQKNTIISLFWGVYAILLLAIGFTLHSRFLRIFGLAFIFIVAMKVFIDVWSLGQLYRIVSSIVFGLLALIGSFTYAKFKDRIRNAI